MSSVKSRASSSQLRFGFRRALQLHFNDVSNQVIIDMPDHFCKTPYLGMVWRQEFAFRRSALAYGQSIQIIDFAMNHFVEFLFFQQRFELVRRRTVVLIP